MVRSVAYCQRFGGAIQQSVVSICKRDGFVVIDSVVSGSPRMIPSGFGLNSAGIRPCGDC